MKKIFRLMMVALMATATMGIVSCDKEDEKTNTPAGNQDMPTYETLERTEWEGSYATTTQTQQGPMTLRIRWTLDFMANGKASVMMVFESQAFDNTPYDWESTYTYDPATGTGMLSDESLGDVPFVVDAINRTLVANLVVYVQHEEGAAEVAYGGQTTLHQVQ